MARRHYNLPPLSALAAFEAAARHLSVTKAAQELNVTPGAISKQIRVLEEELGSPVFLRRHRALELTREGDIISLALKEAFERVSSTWRQVKSHRGQSTVVVGSTLAMAQLWSSDGFARA